MASSPAAHASSDRRPVANPHAELVRVFGPVVDLAKFEVHSWMRLQIPDAGADSACPVPNSTERTENRHERYWP